ncbi:MAG: hypothetical protein M1838_000160 [Thelocarpon superellum]|nr:MAG: hypothetical protein M1838_000160 [Thelocarpon superellum]
MDLSHLLSPPDTKGHDSFRSQRTNSTSSSSSTATVSTLGVVAAERHLRDPHLTLPTIADMHPSEGMAKLPSPPVTPATRLLQHEVKSYSEPGPDGSTDGTDGGSALRDPLLFPHDAGAVFSISNAQPLFPAPEASPTPSSSVDPQVEALLEQHMAMQLNNRFKRSVSRPTRDEYLLALSCVPVVNKKYAQSPRKWWNQERRLLDERFGAANRVWKRPIVRTLAKLAPAPTVPARRAAPTSRAARASRAPRAPKRTPQTKVLHSLEAGSPHSPKRVIGTSREDVDFDALPDYAPSTSTLPKNNAKILKADWKGQMLDLTHDPHRHLLHEAEINLAATLRLSCATYLCSKRRIFMGRLEALRIGKEFRKTDSQQACKIDVNKASKLWAAYDKVGWFNAQHFTPFL